LSSNVNTQATLRMTNTGGRPAAQFVTDPGVAPFNVNTAVKVPNLNSDLLDGFDSAALLKTNSPAGGDLTGPFGNLQIAPGAVGTTELADGAVTSAKVLDDTAGGGLAPEDLAPNSVGTSEIQTDGVQATE